jgi:hypothetical protein
MARIDASDSSNVFQKDQVIGRKRKTPAAFGDKRFIQLIYFYFVRFRSSDTAQGALQRNLTK